MVRNAFSFDGVNAGVLFIDGGDGSAIEHHALARYVARAHGANWSRHGIVEGELSNLAVTVDAARVVTVAPGFAYVLHADGIKYGVVNEANKTLTIPVSSGGTQITAIYLVVDTTAVQASIEQVRAAAGAGNPTIPANSLVLAYVSVPVSGDPTVSLPATRFAVPKGTTTVQGGGGTAGPSGRRATQRFNGETSARAVMHNDRLYSRDATKRWLLDGDNNLLEFDLEEYGFVRNSTPARTFGGASDGKPLMSFWDEANGNLWALKGDRGHILESDTDGRVTTGGSSVAITVVEASARWNFADFGNDRGLGIQSGGKLFVVGNPNGARNALVGEYTITPAAASISAIVIPPNVDALVRHTGNVTLPVRLIAAGDAGSILAAWLATADVANIHTVAQNGRIEQWSGAGAKDATFAELPEGRRPEGGVFNLAVTRGATPAAARILGPAPNNILRAAQVNSIAARRSAIDSVVSAATRAVYDANPQYVLLYRGTSTDIPRVFNRQGGNWNELAASTAAFADVIAAYEGQIAGTAPTNPEGVNGIFTLTRIDGVLCFSGPGLILPVLNPDGQTDFWPYSA